MDEQQEPAAPKAPATANVYELVLAEVVSGGSDSMTVGEHAAVMGLSPWQLAALLGRFKAQGLHVHAHLSADVFKAALHETLHGRV